jgi:hypothetical protein
MKVHFFAALVAVVSTAEFAGITSTGLQVGLITTNMLLDYSKTTPSDHPIWWMESESIYDHDTGYQWLRITHHLKEYIAEDDIVSFDLQFMSEYDPWVDPKNLMIEDSAVCELAINTADTRFWNMTPYDKHVKCSDQNCSSSTLNAWRTGTYTSTLDTINDWEIPYDDDDKDDPFCVPLASDDALYGIYKC